jgi:hypothetical protein
MRLCEFILTLQAKLPVDQEREVDGIVVYTDGQLASIEMRKDNAKKVWLPVAKLIKRNMED